MGNNNYFYSKVAGVTFENKQQYVRQCYIGQKLDLIRDRFNMYDRNAIAVYSGNHQVGFISKELAEKLAPKIDNGHTILCYVEDITGREYNNYGLNIKLVYA